MEDKDDIHFLSSIDMRGVDEWTRFCFNDHRKHDSFNGNTFNPLISWSEPVRTPVSVKHYNFKWRYEGSLLGPETPHAKRGK